VWHASHVNNFFYLDVQTAQCADGGVAAEADAFYVHVSFVETVHLLCSLAGFFSGYLKDPQATEEGWSGGWWHTGDLARYGPDGSLHFVDRKKNVIRRSGENIAALEVEQLLRGCPGIRDAAVAATPDEIRGEEVVACIVPDESANADEPAARRIVAWMLEQAAYYKAPGWVTFVDALPTTPTQKIDRAGLKRLVGERVGEANCFDTRAMKRRDARPVA